MGSVARRYDPGTKRGDLVRRIFESSMKALAVTLLVVLILLTGLPLAMGMGMEGASCPSCPAPDTSLAVVMCLAILSGWSLLVASLTDRVHDRQRTLRRLLIAARLDRPPRSD